MIAPDDTIEFGSGAHNIVTMPNLTGGRLADLLAAASGPAQGHELRGELGARTAFLAAAAAWPSPKRRLRRTPAVLAVTAVATMMVATTGLAAASELPGSAGRAVQGILGSVGVGVTAAPPAQPPAPAPAPVVHRSSVTVGVPPVGSHVHEVVGGVAAVPGSCTSASGSSISSVTGGIDTASCAVPVRHVRVATTTPAPAVTSGLTASPPAVKVRRHSGPGAGSGPGGPITSTGGQGTGSAPGGGSSRGGNVGGGSGTCSTGADGTGATTTTTTQPASTPEAASTPTSSTAVTTTTTTTTTLPTTGGGTTGSGCGTGGHHHAAPTAASTGAGDP